MLFIEYVNWHEDVEEFIASFILIVCLVLLLNPFMAFEKKTKDTVMDKILSFFGNFEYAKSFINNDVIKKSELISDYTSKHIDDEVCGVYNNVEIDVSEAELVIGSGKHRRTVFDGVFILLDFNKNFKGKTIVKRKRAFFSKKEYVSLEDVVFSKKWKVYASDQIEARYILTPAFMERILRVKKLFKGKNIEFSFFDKKILIAIHTYRNMFETTSLLRSTLSYKRIKNVIEQFYSIFSIIDLLDLDDNYLIENNKEI